jgi:hypothetical protein
MTLTSMASLWARTALLWFLATISFGLYLGFTQQFGFSSPHAHMGLLGWVSSCLFAFVNALTGPPPRGARVHWAVHNLGVIGMATAMFLVMKTGDGRWGAMIGMSGLLVALATLWLTVTYWPRLAAR